MCGEGSGTALFSSLIMKKARQAGENQGEEGDADTDLLGETTNHFPSFLSRAWYEVVNIKTLHAAKEDIG